MENQDAEALAKSFLSDGLKSLNTKLDQMNVTGMPRLKLLDEIRQASGELEGRSLDSMREIFEACISYALEIADGNEKAIQYANVTSYNLAANLADCWPDDDEPRSKQHYELGVSLAHRCLEYRRELGKPPSAMAMAYFILGVHQFSLKDYASAEKAWNEKLKNELLEIDDSTQAENDPNVILSHGLIGLARWSLGSSDSTAYDDAVNNLGLIRTDKNGEEVDLFIAELKILKEKHGQTSRA